MFKIKEISNFTGLTIRSLRHYDEKGIIVPKRDDNGHRIYSYDDLMTLYEVKLLKDTGLSLDDIKKHIKDLDAYSLKKSFKRQKQLLQAQLSDTQLKIEKIDFFLETNEDDFMMRNKIINEYFVLNNPLRKETDQIWNPNYSCVDGDFDIKDFKKPVEFDNYFNVLSKIQEKPIQDEMVAEETLKYIDYLYEYYDRTVDSNGLRIIADSYKYNDSARKYLSKYGDHFGSFLCDAMNYYLQK